MDNDTKTAHRPQFVPPPLEATEVVAHCTKSNFFRVIHVDGLFGGPAPTKGNVVMTLFSARFPIPEKIVADGYGNEIIQKRIVKDGVEQECEATLVMSVETAKQMTDWLISATKNAEAMMRT